MTLSPLHRPRTVITKLDPNVVQTRYSLKNYTLSSPPISSLQLKLNDGGWHHICLTWDSGSGNAKVYVEGSLAQKFPNTAKGQTIPAGGTVVLGQDQDKVGGGFQKNQAYTGKLYGVYLWSRVLDASDIINTANDCTVSWLEISTNRPTQVNNQYSELAI